MALFGWTLKDYAGAQKKRVLKTIATNKQEQERNRKKELAKLKRQTETYQARAKFKRARHAASHPFKTGSLRLSQIRKKAGKSGKMRIF